MAAACLTAAPSPRAAADYDETEARLKAAGVDAPLRKQIHEAIERGVAYLLAKQREDGGWQDRPRYLTSNEWGMTALCALALRHAGSPTAKAGARRALDFLLTPRDGPFGVGGTRSPSRESPGVPSDDLGDPGEVYNAGILLMLLMADARPCALGKERAAALANSIDPQSGWWGYMTDAKMNAAVERRVAGMINLSTTQFAALGLWAGGRLGFRVDSSVWSKHADGLCRAQKRNGSWAYSPSPLRIPGSGATFANVEGYPTGTFMGAANLALARKGIEGIVDPKSSLGQRVESAWAAARTALDRDGRRFLWATENNPPAYQLSPMTDFSYYTLYALEKACIFADTERVGSVLWYATGAQGLIRFQAKDGSWSYKGGEDPLVSTAFALLFLLRSSQSYHPATPRDVDSKPSGPVTPGGDAPPGK